jgi:hypothetical protein
MPTTQRELGMSGSKPLCSQTALLRYLGIFRKPMRTRVSVTSAERSGNLPLSDNLMPGLARPDFLNCPSELPSLVAGFDWSRTSLGPIDQ